MSYLNALLTDLRDRKLWPVPLVLLAALVAVPVLLSKSPSVPHASPSLGLAVASAQNGSAVTVDATPIQAPLVAGTRDPFTQQKLPGVTATTTGTGTGTGTGSGSGSTVATGGTSAGAAAASRGSTAVSVSGGASSGNGYYGGTGTTGSTGSGTPTSTPSRPPAPAGLAPTQAYHVSISITNHAGGVTPLDPFLRDGGLPSDKQPLLVEVGVMQGAHRVLFAVQPGAVVSGPGTCTPGPLDCEVLSLAPGQTEAISAQSASGKVLLALFQITGISADRYGSRAAANKARAATDATGRKLLANSASATLPLFQYDPSLDAVVDERNLTVGGN